MLVQGSGYRVACIRRGVTPMFFHTAPLAYTWQIELQPQAQIGMATRRAKRSFAFGPFVLEPERQALLKDGNSVRIGGRALDILTLLVERSGEVVGKRELFERAWPDTFVDEANLKVNMAGIRRALGEGPGTARYIATVVGRGYRFVADVVPTRASTRQMPAVALPRFETGPSLMAR
ncbi:winged helix-turn-helix domain-containing protein [Sphingomonas arantia]